MPFTQHIERVPANAELVLKGLDVRARAEALAGLTERVAREHLPDADGAGRRCLPAMRPG